MPKLWLPRQPEPVARPSIHNPRTPIPHPGPSIERGHTPPTGASAKSAWPASEAVPRTLPSMPGTPTPASRGVLNTSNHYTPRPFGSVDSATKSKAAETPSPTKSAPLGKIVIDQPSSSPSKRKSAPAGPQSTVAEMQARRKSAQTARPSSGKPTTASKGKGKASVVGYDRPVRTRPALMRKAKETAKRSGRGNDTDMDP